jgi:hypothetical protein
MNSHANSTLSKEPRLELDPFRLAAANINPLTGLATDYLNHFNEGVMLLEILASAPDCLPDFLAWQPMTYAEHFTASNFKDREIAIAAYEAADPVARQQLDALADTMTSVLTATREAMQIDTATPATVLATRAAAWLKPLVARAGAIINGNELLSDDQPASDVPQDTIDAVMAHGRGVPHA